MELDKDIILNHELVPKHELLSKEDAERVLSAYSITPDLLPKIKSTDAVARATGAKKGSIIKITRRSPTAGEALYYRLVI